MSGVFTEVCVNPLPLTAPFSPPQNVIVNVVSSTEITVEWNEVPEIDQNGIITEYEILYEPFTTFGGQLPANNSYIVPPLNTNVSISSLQEYVGYYVSVRASTREGFGPYSGRISVLTEEDGENCIDLLYRESGSVHCMSCLL